MISIIVPVYNESGNFKQVLTDLLAEIRTREAEAEIIAVDDGSTDDSAATIGEVDGVRLVSHRTNRGYGASLKTGFQAAQGGVVVTFDADGQHEPADIWKLLDALTDGVAVVGDRGRRHRSPLWRAPGKWILARLVNFLAKERIPDFNSGLRAAKREDFLAIGHLCADRFSFSASSTLAFLSQGLRVVSIPIAVRPRSGKSSMRMSAALDTLIAILRVTMTFDPLRIFLPAAILTGLVGFGWLVHGLIRVNVSDICVLLLLSSFQMFMLGLVADMIAQLRKTRL